MDIKKITLKKIIKKAIDIFWVKSKKLIGRMGYQITKNTEKEKIVNLIKSLRPYRTNIDLVRFGGATDGGYLVPNDLEGIKTCFSPGVDTESSFEIDCLNRGMEVYMADNSVEKPNINNTKLNFNFIKKHIGTTSNDDFITFTQWVSESKIGQEDDLLLQMDIEGTEYLTLLSIDESLLKRFRIILIEFHFLEKLWDRDFFILVNLAVEKLMKTHSCVHIHPNNCSDIYKYKGVEIPSVLEFSFLRNDRISKKERENKFPHKLDIDNLKDKKSIVLPKIWYKD